MAFFTRHKLLIVLIALLAITALAWAMTRSAIISGQALALFIVLLAFIKARLIIIHYMDVSAAHAAVRWAFEAWVVIAALGTVLLYGQWA